LTVGECAEPSDSREEKAEFPSEGMWKTTRVLTGPSLSQKNTAGGKEGSSERGHLRRYASDLLKGQISDGSGGNADGLFKGEPTF